MTSWEKTVYMSEKRSLEMEREITPESEMEQYGDEAQNFPSGQFYFCRGRERGSG